MINHKKLYFCNRFAAVAQLVERQLPKLQVAGSRPVYRSKEAKRMVIQPCAFLYFHLRFSIIFTTFAR